MEERHSMKENFIIAVKELLEAIGIDTKPQKPKLPEPSCNHDADSGCDEAGDGAGS